MKIRITGRAEEVTGAMKERAHRKVSKLLKYYDRITWVDVVMDVDRQRKKVEVNVGLNRGTTLTGRSEGGDMYAVIDLAVDKIARRIRRHKDRIRDHRSRRSDTSPEPPSGEEAGPAGEGAIEDF